MPTRPRFGHRFGFRGSPDGDARGMNFPAVAPVF
jgi:hypothetical protein